MAEPEFQDLIIVKRRLNTEPETPKGGVWKIAFADFMTAMMCFFLVMWLINAANEDTRKAVASYFNPVRLSELNRKGVENPHNQSENPLQTGERTREDSKPSGAPPTSSASSTKASADVSREALFKDPYRVLSDIAGEPAPAAGAASSGGDVAAAGAGPFRDPFDPDVFMDTPAAPPEGSVSAAASPTEMAESNAQSAETPSAVPLRLSLPSIEAASVAADGSARMSPAPEGSTGTASPPSAETMDQDGAANRSALQAELSEAVRAETASNRRPTIAVEQTGEGMMISLTDDVDFGMFSIGSAEPQPQMVHIMERIAAVLKSRGGSITIRGHTDARPFRTAGYDNWRLSTDRAQMAYYMLVRGGLDEKRVVAIEGYADRRLKKPGDPEAAENRRIEILLSEPT